MKLMRLENVFVDELRDIYSAENQMSKVLPRMARASEWDDLRNAFEQHLEQTRRHAERIAQICEKMNVSPKGRKCMGMEGLIQEGQEVLESEGEPVPLQAAIIGSAQRVEHYEIAAYGTAAAHARQLGFMDAADLLGKTLQEEKETDEKLTRLAENRINVQAAMKHEYP